MRRTLRALCVGVVCALSAVPWSASPVRAAPGDPAIPGLTLTVASGTSSTTFALVLPTANRGCPGNALADGFRWQQYLVSAAVDPGSLTYSTSGPVLPAGAPAGSVAQPLYSTFGTPQVNRITLGTAAPYAITGTSTLNLNVNRLAGLADGDYKIGFACSKAGVTHKYWETTITVAAPTPAPSAVLYWAIAPGLVPAAPTGLTAEGTTFDGSTITGAFSPVVTAVPGVSNYTVTATPVGGGAAVTTSVAGGGPYTFSLAVPNSPPNYDVTVTATNRVGTSAAATVANLEVAPADVAAPAVMVTEGRGTFTVDWTTPVAPAAAVLLGYTVTATGAVGSPFTVAAGINTLTVTAPEGTYPTTVRANYAAPFNGETSAPVDAIAGPAPSVVVQDITVPRPQGALVLTQRCGVYGSAIAYSDDVFGALPLLPATAGADPDNDNGTPADPTDDFYDTLPSGSVPQLDSAPFDPFSGTNGTTDPLIPGYPYPVNGDGDSIATYPTNCGVILDTPRLITSGPAAGQYFRTTGRIAQLTVVNTQNVDSGWTLNGTMGNFSNGTDSFSGNLMGWDPEVTWDSLANLDGYDMEATAGGRRQPVADAADSGLGESFNAANTTLASSLAQSSAGSSLGMAVMDARLRLLVPVDADGGTYAGALTFTIV